MPHFRIDTWNKCAIVHEKGHKVKLSDGNNMGRTKKKERKNENETE